MKAIGRLAALLLLAVTAAALAGCAAESNREKKRDDASNYNMQLGVAYLNRGDLGLAKQIKIARWSQADSQNQMTPLRARHSQPAAGD